jgi:hypothetical protein
MIVKCERNNVYEILLRAIRGVFIILFRTTKCQTNSRNDLIRRAHLKGHGVWPCSRKLVRAEILVTEGVHLRDLVAFQTSREAWCATYAVKLKHRTEHLAHDFGRQLDPKRACHSVASQVAALQLAMDVHCLWIGEHIGLLYIPIDIEEHTDDSGNLHLGWHEQGQQIHVAP